jgi:anti-sigma regulatory factor (Ser/Thr protein kinase)
MLSCRYAVRERVADGSSSRRGRTAARRARRLLEELAAGTIGDDPLNSAKLLVSELVNNAVLHGRDLLS